MHSGRFAGTAHTDSLTKVLIFLLLRAFADALEQIPLALAENCGLAPIQTLTQIKAQQVAENNSGLGVNCMEGG